MTLPAMLLLGLFVFLLAQYASRVRRLGRLGARFEASVLADSVHASTGARLTTMLLTYPRRPVHDEFMTHRLFARNASSSRAVPAKRVRRDIRARMALPVGWGTNRPGMQAGATASPARRAAGLFVVVLLGDLALLASAVLDRLGLHKQIVNRVTETWGHITVIVTGTDQAWHNFFALRVHEAADPAMFEIADQARNAYRASTPQTLQPGEWHLPLVEGIERKRLLTARTMDGIPFAVVASTARCARTSYLNHDGTQPNVAKDLATYQQLVGGTPKHASPAEHQAQAVDNDERAGCLAGHGKVNGWAQHRKMINSEATFS